MAYFGTDSYTNAVIVNRSIFVPLFDIPADALALQTWREAMPGYVVRGFTHRGWKNTDALHCRVRGIWDPHMLYLTHRPPEPTVDGYRGFTPTVQIRDYSGAGLIKEQLQLHWRTRGTTQWRQAPLQPTSQDHVYANTIDRVPPGEAIEYYFAAASRSGRRETLPRTAPQAVYAFAIAARVDNPR